MKHIAIVTPGVLPVPAVSGGAVEVLVTHLLEENEKNPVYVIDLYTICHEELNQIKYDYTNIIQIRPGRFLRAVDNGLDIYCRHAPWQKKSIRCIDRMFEKEIRKRIHGYDFIVVENIVSLAKRICGIAPGGCGIFFHMHNDIDIYRSKDDIEKLAGVGVQFLAISGYIRGQIKKAAPNAVVHLLYNGVDREVFQPAEKTENSGNFIYFFSGRMIPSKGAYELVQAFHMLRQKDKYKNKNVCLVIAGSTDFAKKKLSVYEKKVYALTNAMGESVSVKGKMPAAQMAALYREADVVMIPSVWEEPFGMVALEALAMGKAVIHTDSGGLKEIFDEGCSICVSREPKELFVQGLCEAMEKMQDTKFREEIQNNGYKKLLASPQFWKENYFKKFVKCCEETDGKRTRVGDNSGL